MIKVAWICSFSNAEIRDVLVFEKSLINRVAFRLMGVDITRVSDSAIWNVNAIKEVEKFNDIELHIICLTRFLKNKQQDFELRNVHYHFLREENSAWYRFLFHQLFTRYSSRFHKNRRAVKDKLTEISPDIVHVMGAENPYYSLSLLDVPSNIPTIIQLQALLDRIKDDPRIKNGKKSPYYRGGIEKEIIRKADYIGTKLQAFKDYILKEIHPNARFLDLTLAMAQEINLEECKKEYDFVYFALVISKAGEEALKTFSIIHQRHPELTLDIIGGYDDALKEKLDAIVSVNNMQNVVYFEGKLATHEDVIRQIRKARFALLPLKMDFVPNTIREAMANGLPVVTTVTDGTPKLNSIRQSVLLSPQGDFEAMADNVDLLLKDPILVKTLRENAALTEKERSNNHEIVDDWRKAYYAILG